MNRDISQASLLLFYPSPIKTIGSNQSERSCRLQFTDSKTFRPLSQFLRAIFQSSVPFELCFSKSLPVFHFPGQILSPNRPATTPHPPDNDRGRPSQRQPPPVRLSVGHGYTVRSSRVFASFLYSPVSCGRSWTDFYVGNGLGVSPPNRLRPSAKDIFYTTCWPLMVSWNTSPSRSAARRHRIIRLRKISKKSITELKWVSTVSSSRTAFSPGRTTSRLCSTE